MVPPRLLGGSCQPQGLGYSGAMGKASGMQSSGTARLLKGTSAGTVTPGKGWGTSGTNRVVLWSLLLEPGVC